MDYFRRNPRLDISDETKLYADDASSKEFYSTTIEGKNNFITEVFFLAVAAHHYGLGSAQTRHDSLGRDVPELERHLERIEADRQRFLNVRSMVVTGCGFANDGSEPSTRGNRS